MKKETYAKKLVEMFGLEEKVDVSVYSDKPASKRKRFAGIPEEEIQTLREGQALLLFFQAPELFSKRICKHCGDPFLVSRHQVIYCSYDCIEREVAKLLGVKWTRRKDMELMVKEVYDGNEPLWIRNIDRIKSIIETAEETNLVGV